MLKIKNDNGVTIVVLVVTIVVLLILAGITIDMGDDSINSTKDRKMQAELEMIQQACISEYTKAKQLGYLDEIDKAEQLGNLEDMETAPANFVGTVVEVGSLPSISTGWVYNTEPTVSYKKYFRLTPEDLEVLNILNSEYTYIVNYYTGEVYNESKKNSSEQIPLYIKSVTEHQTDSTVDDTSFTDW